MIPLSDLNQQEKLWFLEDALLDTGATLRRLGFLEEGARYINYVLEMRGQNRTRRPAMGEMKPTPGPWTVLPEESDKDYLRIRGTRLGGRYKVANVHMPRHWESHDVLRDRENAESQANARLIAEAGTVFHNTGLSPVQLVEQRDELLAALKACAAVCAGKTMSKRGLVSALEQARAALAKCEGVGND